MKLYLFYFLFVVLEISTTLILRSELSTGYNVGLSLIPFIPMSIGNIFLAKWITLITLKE